MNIVEKIKEVKNIFFEIYDIIADPDETKFRDEEINQRVKKDVKLEKKMAKVLDFPKEKSRRNIDENKDISAI